MFLKKKEKELDVQFFNQVFVIFRDKYVIFDGRYKMFVSL